MTMNGIDISYWDSGLVIRNVSADFVICKATEGVGFTDPTFRNFADQTLACGRLLGAYHFARSNSGPEEQADYFVATVKPYLGRCTLWLDWENAEGYDHATLDQGPTWALRWLRRVKRMTGITPGIYTSKSVCNSYDWRAVCSEGYPLWGAEYASMNTVYGYQSRPWQSAAPWGPWGRYPSIHQYTGNLALSGTRAIEFDGDIAYMSREDWQALASREDEDMTNEQAMMLEAVYDAICRPHDASGRGKDANVPDRLAWMALKQEKVMDKLGVKEK